MERSPRLHQPNWPHVPLKAEHLQHGQAQLHEIVSNWLAFGECEEWEQLVNQLSAEDFTLGQYVLHMTDRTDDVGMKSLIAGTALVIYAAMQAATVQVQSSNNLMEADETDACSHL